MRNQDDIFAQTIQHALIYQAAENKLAIVWEDATGQIISLSYQNLLEKALKQAVNLQCLKPIRIGVWLPRTADYVTTFLSIWIAGGVYVPITDASVKRLRENREFREDFEKRVRALSPHLDAIIADAARIEILQTLTSVKLIDIQELSQENSNSLKVTPRTLQSEAFVYCSSGTTGTPKIIALPYEGVEDRVNTVTQEMGITAQDSILNYTGFDFDPSLMEMIQAILFGCPLIMAPEYARCDPRAMGIFYEKLAAQGIANPTLAIIVPSMLKVMDPTLFVDLRALMTTGENILPQDLAPWFAINDFLRIFTGYGPTEMTWGATLTEITRDPICIHVSKPMRGIEIFLVPSEGMHEILIGGNGQGTYLGENAEANTQQNWTQHEGRRCFNPHDGVAIEDGKYIYCGRIDDVIKYHGKWINLETIDAMAERFPGVEFATTVSISGTSLIFAFLVLRDHAKLCVADLETHFRAAMGCELFPTFFQSDTLKYNSRGKRCRHLKDYQNSRPLSSTKPSAKSLTLLWMQALAEADLAQIQAAFSAVGIVEYQNYLSDFGPEDRFDEWGGRSLKLTRLISLLWDEYIKDPHISQLTFKHGILRHQTFQAMSQFIRLYQAVRTAFPRDQVQFGQDYSTLWITIQWSFPESCLIEFCDILISEIRACYPAPFYHFILNCDSQQLLTTMRSVFTGIALVDDSFHISLPKAVERKYLQQRIKQRLAYNPNWDIFANQREPPSVKVPVGNRLTLLGSDCGKTTVLKRQHEQLKRADKIVCYVSCRQLMDEPLNLQSFLALSQLEWEILCEGQDLLSEIHWLIDDIEIGVRDNRLHHLQNCLWSFKGTNLVIYSGRENFYPSALQNPNEYGQIELLQSDSEVDPHLWFDREADRIGISRSTAAQQVEFLITEFLARKYIRDELKSTWWATDTPVQTKIRHDLPPLYLSQYPMFPSLMRFLKYHDTMVYSLRTKFRDHLQLWLLPRVTYSTTKSFQGATKDLPPHICYYPGESHLSPWICFHSVSGKSPEAYIEIAETIYTHSKQATIIISMPDNQQWPSLAAQVKSYLDSCMDHGLVRPGSPYYLMGWSYGGYCAVEAARQLENQGCQVAVVVNLDAAPIFADPNFRWQQHREYIKDQILKSAHPTALLKGMEYNATLLQNYCGSTFSPPLVRATNYIFQALDQPETLRGLDFAAWQLRVSSVEICKCECDHFGIFSNSTFRSGFLKIIERYREAADLRPLPHRLDEKAKAYIRQQNALRHCNLISVAPALEQKIYRDFLENADSPPFLIIEGVAGVGKSHLVNHLAYTLISERQTSVWTPVVIPLKLYVSIRDINHILRLYGLSHSELKQPIRYLFIIDGFEEGDLDLIAFPLQISEIGKISKVIITARKGVMPPQLPLARYTWELPMLDDDGLAEWLQAFDPYTSQQIKTLLQDKKSTLDWVRTPLALSMLLKLQQSGFDTDTVLRSLFQLYRSLDEKSLQENCSLLTLTALEVQRSYRHYTESLAMQERVPHHSLWNHPDTLTQSFKKSAQLLEQHGQLIFSHDTWRDYHLANALINAVLQFKPSDDLAEMPSILSRFKLALFPKNIFLITLLTDFWDHADQKSRFVLRKNLFSIAFLSQKFKFNELETHAATLAMELLNIFQVSFAGLTLANLELHDCDLSGGRFARTHFFRSSLRGTNFTNADMEYTHFTGADLSGLNCGESQSLGGTAAAYDPAGHIFVLAQGGTLQIHDAVEYKEIYRQQISEHAIVNIAVFSQNLIACHTEHECILVNGPAYTAFLLSRTIFKELILDIVFSPQADEIALYFSAGICLVSTKNIEQQLWLPTARNLGAPPIHNIVLFVRKPRISYHPSRPELAAIHRKQLHIWNRSTNRLIQVNGITDDSMISVVYHPKRELLIANGLNGLMIYVIETINHTCIGQYTHSTIGASYRIADLTRDHLLVHDRNTVYRYDLSIMSNAPAKIHFPNDFYIVEIKVSPCGRRLAAAGTRRSGTEQSPIFLVDFSTDQIEKRLDVSGIQISEILFHPASHHLATLLSDGSVRLWPLSLKPCLQQVMEENHHDLSYKVMPAKKALRIELPAGLATFHPHSRTIVPIYGKTGKLYLSDISSDETLSASAGYLRRSVLVHQTVDDSWREFVIPDISGAIICHLAFIPYSKKILVATADTKKKQIHIMDSLTGTCEHSLWNASSEQGLVLSPDGQVVIYRSANEITITRLNEPVSSYTLVQLHESRLRYQPFAHHPSKKQIIAVDEAELAVLEPEHETYTIRRIQHHVQVISVAYQPFSDELATITRIGTINFWDMNSLNCLATRTIQLPLPSYDALSLLYIAQVNLCYSPRGDYLAISGDITSIQIWNAKYHVCIHEIPSLRFTRQLEWLFSPVNNSQGNPLYYLSLQEKNNDINVYEIAVKTNASVEVTLIWGSSRHAQLQGREYLRASTDPQQNRPPPIVIRSHLSDFPLDILLRISDYLYYRDYAHFVEALRLSPVKLVTNQKRPLIDPIIWKKRAPYVGEQLQRLGFFALNRAADIHHLCLATNDSYQNVVIAEKNGDVCGEIDVYLLHDFMRLASRNKI